MDSAFDLGARFVQVSVSVSGALNISLKRTMTQFKLWIIYGVQLPQSLK